MDKTTEPAPISPQGLKYIAELERLTLVFADKVQETFLSIAGNQLMEMSDRAKTNDQQWHLLQLAREIKNQQPQLQTLFKQPLKEGFQQFRNGELGGKTTSSSDMSSDLSLLANDELERDLAATTLARKIDTRLAETLYSLNQRLALINGGKKLPEDGSPVGAYQFAIALQSLIDHLKLDTRLGILFFRIFEKELLEQTPDFYQALNDYMIQQGILPNLRYGKSDNPIRNTTGGASAVNRETKAETKAETVEEAVITQQKMYEAIQNLQKAQAAMENGHSPSPVPPSPATNAPAAPVVQTNGYQPGFFSQPGFSFSGNAAVAVCQPQEVITALARMPTTQQAAEIEQAIVKPMTVEQYQAVTMHVRQELGEDKRIGDDEGKVIDIVGMIFEFMLGDKQLPDPVKAVLSYLHTPYLKMALLEGDLLKNPEHASRQLLNCLAEAGTKWVGADGDSQFKAFPKIKSIVRRVIIEFTNDASLFRELLEEMQEYNKKVENSVALVERRSREKAEGEDRLREVKRTVLTEVRSRMDGVELPSPVIVLLLHPWSDYLTFTLLRHGNESTQWQEALETISDIIWSIQPKTDINERNRLMMVQEPLQQRVQEGLETIAYDQGKSNKLIDALHQSQMLALQNLIAEPAAAEKRAELEGEAMKQAGTSDVVEPEAILTSAEAELVEKLRTIEFGTWMEFDQLDALHNQRVKVAWFNARTSRYMLVDRTGKQVAMKTGAEIARMMLASQARMIAGSAKPFFERAMENIFARLKAAMAR